MIIYLYNQKKGGQISHLTFPYCVYNHGRFDENPPNMYVAHGTITLVQL